MSNNHFISLQTAIELTTRYRNNRPADFFICETFDSDAVQALLNVTGCAYLRIYLGRKADDSVVSILVAANSNEEDILPSSLTEPFSVTDDAGATVLLEDGYRCPEFCPPKSSLNS